MPKSTTLSRRAFSVMVATSGLAAPFVARAQSAKRVTFLLDVPAYSKHALFYPAIDNGYFAKRGLEVTFGSAKGSADAAQRLASKAAEFGFIDAGVAALARGKGLPLKLTSMVAYRNMMSMVGFGDPPVTKPKDLEGRKIAAAPGDSVRTGFIAISKPNGVDMGKVDWVTTDSTNKRTLLFSGKVGATCDYAVNFPVYEMGAAKLGKKVSQILLADFGLDIYSNGITTRDDLIKSDPALVKGFNDALVESMVFSVDNRDEAVRIFLKHNPQFDPDLTRKGLDVTIAHLMVPEVVQHGIGPMDPAKVAKTIEVMKAHFDLAADVKPADIFTNDYVTPGHRPTKAA
ncbi:MAG: ABC transporter substrate-binding protein [Proteobacteria bacterium]|nr:ABC transporter substrate-binding protein [Pseudomonadota bacterium]